MLTRSSGVLMHITSLPNAFGIGSFGQSAYEFVDFLVETKQTYWQILPLTTTVMVIHLINLSLQLQVILTLLILIY